VQVPEFLSRTEFYVDNIGFFVFYVDNSHFDIVAFDSLDFDERTLNLAKNNTTAQSLTLGPSLSLQLNFIWARMLRHAIQCNAMPRNATQCYAIPCNAVQCRAMTCNAIQWKIIWARMRTESEREEILLAQVVNSILSVSHWSIQVCHKEDGFRSQS
jgi:hypothetical protein